MRGSKQNSYTARIVDIVEKGQGTCSVTAMIGDKLHIFSVKKNSLKIGDIYLASDSGNIDLEAKIGDARSTIGIQDSDAWRWRKPDHFGQTRFSALWQRQTIRQSIRSYLDAEGFLEIDSPLLVRGTTPDAAIHSFSVDEYYLATSTEYQIKRLISGGFDRIYTLTQNFRRSDGEGPYRNQEFTMLEWARVGMPLVQIEKDAEEMVLLSHQALGGNGLVKFNAHQVDLSPPWDRRSVASAIQISTGVVMQDFSKSSIALALKAASVSISPTWEDDVPFLFSILMDHIQPSLGCSKPVFLQDWPSFETSSALEKAEAGLAERSELFIAGVEISDGFPSLTSYKRQKQTFEDQNHRRQREGSEQVSLDSAYLSALHIGLPSGAGMALGFDRLVMILTGRNHIRDVLAFHHDEL